MSTPAFLLLSLPVGLAAIGLFVLIAKPIGKLLDPLLGTEATAARLQRRLERRLARGDDRYFEELRSIECAIASNRQAAARSRPDFRRWPYSLLWLFGALWFGTLLLAAASPKLGLAAPPAWTRYLGVSVAPVLGLIYVLDPNHTGFPTRRSALISGAFFVVLGGILFATDIWS